MKSSTSIFTPQGLQSWTSSYFPHDRFEWTLCERGCRPLLDTWEAVEASAEAQSGTQPDVHKCTNIQHDTERAGGVSASPPPSLKGAHPHTYLWQAETGLHADFVETLILFQDVCQSQSGGRSRELFQSWDGLLLEKHNIRNCM